VTPVAPVPGVVERLDLRLRPRAGRRAEQDIVGGLRVERRVEINEVHASGIDMFAQYVEVVAIVQAFAARFIIQVPTFLCTDYLYILLGVEKPSSCDMILQGLRFVMRSRGAVRC